MIKKSKLKSIILISCLIVSFSVFAQFDDGEEPPVEDPPPPAPINQWIPAMIIGGIAFIGYKTLKSNTKSGFSSKESQ